MLWSHNHHRPITNYTITNCVSEDQTTCRDPRILAKITPTILLLIWLTLFICLSSPPHLPLHLSFQPISYKQHDNHSFNQHLMFRLLPLPVPWLDQRHSPEDCSRFTLQCSLYFEMQSHQFINDCAQVAFVMSLLSGHALQWAQSLWNSTAPITSLSAFFGHFKKVFGQTTLKLSVHDQLFSLRQANNSVSVYTTVSQLCFSASHHRLGFRKELHLNPPSSKIKCPE